MRLTPLEWGLGAPITPRLGGNCWALPRLGEIGAERRKIYRPQTQNFGYFREKNPHQSRLCAITLGVYDIAQTMTDKPLAYEEVIRCRILSESDAAADQ